MGKPQRNPARYHSGTPNLAIYLIDGICVGRQVDWVDGTLTGPVND